MPKPAKRAETNGGRVTSGIPGLDSLIEGGFPDGTANLISGSTGTGKTILCVQFLLEGARKGENGLFINLEHSEDKLMNDMSRFTWYPELKKAVESKKIIIDSKDPFELEKIAQVTADRIKELKARRVVIDSSSLIGANLDKPHLIRQLLLQLIKYIVNSGATTLMTAELPEESKALSTHGVEEYISDGVIVLRFNEFAKGAGSPHSILVRKMRKTSHEKISYPMEITDKGISVKIE